MNQAFPSPARWNHLALVLIFAVAMGLLEAICVIYLRRLLPDVAAGAAPMPRFPIELWREACTIVMLATVGWLAGWNLVTRFSYFLAAFGIWDIFYYVGLFIWSGWPPSLWTWDCLFLIPCPWYGPVLAPALISLSFVGACVVAIWFDGTVREIRATPARGFLLTVAWAIWILAFILPAYRRGAAPPSSFPWWAFALGMVMAVWAMWPVRTAPR